MSIFKTSMFVVAISAASMGLAFADNSCIVHLSAYHWSGTANAGGEPVTIKDATFNPEGTVMIMSDNLDKTPIANPVHITCLPDRKFTVVYVTDGQDDPVKMNLKGRWFPNQVYMSGTKQVYQSTQEINVSMSLTPSE